ncbi:MAG TPA: T9SS type A sorting domain-containing protein [Cytophagaceae bacterium]|jgi:hypothetical protein
MNKKLQSIIVIIAFLSFGNVLSAGAQTHSDSVAYTLSTTPNPFDDRLEIRIKGNTPVIKYIKITDIIGKEVAFLDVADRPLPINYYLDFSGLKQGLYLCNVYSEKGLIETKRLYRNK